MKEILIKYPTQERSKDKFQRILKACPRVFAQHGYRKSSTAKIAVEAEVGIGTLYDYFSSKEAVFIAFLDHELNQALESVVEKAAKQIKDPVITMHELVRVGIEFAFYHRDIIRVVLSEMPENIDKIDFATSRDQIERIAANFVSNVEIDFNRRDPNLMIHALTNLVLGFQMRIVFAPDESISNEMMVDELTRMAVGYVFPRV